MFEYSAIRRLGAKYVRAQWKTGFSPVTRRPTNLSALHMGGQLSLGHLSLSWLLGTLLAALLPSDQSAYSLFGALLGNNKPSDLLAPTWMLCTSQSLGAFRIARYHPGYSAPCRMLVLFLLFWETRMLRLVNNVKKRVPSGWNALNDSEDCDQ